MTALPDDLEDRLRAALPGGFRLEAARDSHGVGTAWCELANAADLWRAGEMLKGVGARLSTITAMQPHLPEEEEDDAPPPAPASLGGLPIDGKTYEVLYHFDLDGATLSLRVFLPEGGGELPSLTPLFRNADWNERELMEIYALTVVGHPDPRRLFLDENLDPAVLERLIPFSTLVNAASTKSLWEKIVAHAEEEERP